METFWTETVGNRWHKGSSDHKTLKDAVREVRRLARERSCMEIRLIATSASNPAGRLVARYTHAGRRLPEAR